MMTAEQLIRLQEAYKSLKESLQTGTLHPNIESKIKSAMENIQLTLQVQGVFIG